MSVAIWYRTSTSVSRAVADRIISEARGLPPLSWYEPIYLEAESLDPTFLKGWSKCPGMSAHLDDGRVIEVAEVDWWFMNYWDFRKLCEQLSTWSTKYGLDWVVSAEGDTIGEIHRGKPNRRLRRDLASSAKNGGATFDDKRDEARAQQLLHQYPFF